MADAKLGILLTADTAQATGNIAILEKQLERLQKIASLPNLSFKQQERLNTMLLQTQTQITRFNKATELTNPSLKTFTSSTNQSTLALTNLGRVVQDAPFGFLGIANNLNPLLESFQRLKATTGSTGGALSALKGALMGPAGIGIALSAVSSLLIVFGDKLFGAGSSTSQFSKILSEAKDEFTEAYKNVQLLTTNIQLAKDGFISKEGVVKQYNETIGKTTGLVSSLNEAEAALNKNAQAYIDFTLKKAVANIALGKAAELAFKLEQKQQQFNEVTGGNLTPFEEVGRPAALEKISRQMGNIRKEMEKMLSIGNQAKGEAGMISKLFGFDFFDSNKIQKIKKKIEDQREKLGSIFIELTPILSDKPELSLIKQSVIELEKKIRSRPDLSVSLKPTLIFSKKVLDDQKTLEQIRSLAQDLGNAFNQALSSSIQGGLEAFSEGFANILSGKDFGAGIINVIGSLLSTLGQALIKYGIIKEGLDKIFGPGGILIPGSLAIGLGVLAVAAGQLFKNFGGARAGGGPVAANRSYLVGEKGAEIFVPSTPGTIIPNGKMNSLQPASPVIIFNGRLAVSGNEIKLLLNRTDRYAATNV